MSESKVVLLPCPFCGDDYDKGEMKMFAPQTGAKWTKVTCRVCGASAPTEAWNKRTAAPSADQGELVKRVTLNEREILGIASAAYSEGIAEGGPSLKHFVRAIRAALKAALQSAEAGRKDAAMLDGSDAAELTRKLLWHAQNFEKVDSLTLRKVVGLIQSQANDAARIDWFEKHTNMELAHEWGEDSQWKIFRVSGMPNDREFAEISDGDTVREAIDAAIAGKTI